MTWIPPALAVNPWLTHTARIADIVSECDGIATYRLCLDTSDNASAYVFEPGQFNMLYVPGVGESAISMSGDAHEPDGWIHTVRVAGNVTRSLAQLECGQTLGVRGPFGTGWPIPQLVGKNVVVVAGGLGLAPLRPLVYHLVRHRSQFQNVSLIVGARTAAGLLYPTEYANWTQAGIDVQLTVDRATAGWNGNIGVVTALLDRLKLNQIERASVVTCGPEVMMKYVGMSAMQRGIPAEQIWVSMERNMQCAAGLCGHCQLGPAFICKDGPVLRYDRLQPYLFVESL
ncbi:MAG: FAD/NAD(P)-binding protein [Planctomycetes bacterium]|nr:FAD/NAD(P)-binding protein [Planctomycetota bacterium]